MSATAGLPLVLIAAVARNGVIGFEGRMPWRLPGDMVHFKAMTGGKPVVMGRRTFETIGHPLSGRPTLVLSGDPRFAPPGVTVARSIDALFGAAQAAGARIGADAIMVAGGGSLYEEFLPQADRIILTEVDAEPTGDTLFPRLDPTVWREQERRRPERHDGDTTSYSFLTFTRRHPL